MGVVVRDWTKLAVLLDKAKAAGKTVVTTNGVFDVLHIGHVRYLQQARNLGDLLVVGINSDACTRRLKGAPRPYVPEDERAELLAALACVDYVTVFDEPTPETLLETLRPTIHAKGGDYDIEAMPETPVVRKYGGEVVTLPFVMGRSTTELTERIAAALQANPAGKK